LAVLPPSLLHEEAKLERVDVASGGFQSFFCGRFNRAHVTALQGFAPAQNQGMR